MSLPETKSLKTSVQFPYLVLLFLSKWPSTVVFSGCVDKFIMTHIFVMMAKVFFSMKKKNILFRIYIGQLTMF